jgi:hypothetical protein
MLRITAKMEGFRRCGVAHPAQPTDHLADFFTEGQIEILKAEPMLTVVEVEEAVKLTANEVIAKAKAAATIEELDELAKGEDRKSAMAVIEARRKELSA